MHEVVSDGDAQRWNTVRLGDVASCTLGGTPSTAVQQFWGGSIPWMASGDVHLRRIRDVPGRITAAGLASSNAVLVPPPAVAVGLAGQGKTRGTVALTLSELSTNQSIALLRGDGIRLKTEYLFHNLDRRYEELRARSSGGGRGGLSKGVLDAVPIDLPTLPEQQVIAEILDTLDTTIRQTEAIIEKLKQVKQGLLHDLLTRGIDANGKLRAPQSQAPRLYKDSPLGWIPREWQVERLPALALGGLMNGVFKEPKRVGTGVPLVNVADLYRGQNVDLCGCERFAATSIEIERFGARRGDIFFTRSSLKLGGIAHTSFLDEEPEGAVFECHVMRLRPNPTLSVPRYLKEWCVSRHARTHFMSHAKQVTMTTISQDGINSLYCPVPPLEEQREGVRRIMAVDEHVSTEVKNSRKSQLLKSGLMDDLLTGRVRVTPLLAGATP